MTESANNPESSSPIMARSGFGRIFERMYRGSMVGAGPHVFAVWPYVIAHMRGHPEYGALVELNPKLLAFILGDEELEVVKAIDYLCREDGISGTPTEGGRRLVRVGTFLYRVVNGAAYLSLRKAEEKKFKHAQRQKRYSDRKNSKTRAQVRAENDAREARFVKADGDRDEKKAGEIAAEGLKPSSADAENGGQPPVGEGSPATDAAGSSPSTGAGLNWTYGQKQ